MSTIFTILTWFFGLGLVAGLIKPIWITKKETTTRKEILKLNGSVFLFVLICSYIVDMPPSKFSHNDMTLAEYKKESAPDRHDIIEEYTTVNKIPDATEDFYACVSEYAYTKLASLKLGEIIGWCDTDYKKDPNLLKDMVNIDKFEDQFSPWDGSHYELEKLIKNGMNDANSYEHVSTHYNLILGKHPYATIKTVFRGKNAYGGIVKNIIEAKVDAKTGKVLEIIS